MPLEWWTQLFIGTALCKAVPSMVPRLMIFHCNLVIFSNCVCRWVVFFLTFLPFLICKPFITWIVIWRFATTEWTSVPNLRSHIAIRGFGGLIPPQKAPNWNTKHYKSVEFYQTFRRSSPLHKHKPPIENFLATVLNLSFLLFSFPCCNADHDGLFISLQEHWGWNN